MYILPGLGRLDLDLGEGLDGDGEEVWYQDVESIKSSFTLFR